MSTKPRFSFVKKKQIKSLGRGQHRGQVWSTKGPSLPRINAPPNICARKLTTLSLREKAIKNVTCGWRGGEGILWTCGGIERSCLKVCRSVSEIRGVTYHIKQKAKPCACGVSSQPRVQEKKGRHGINLTFGSALIPAAPPSYHGWCGGACPEVWGGVGESESRLDFVFSSHRAWQELNHAEKK